MRWALRCFHSYFDAVLLDLGDALVYLRNHIWRRGVALINGRSDYPADTLEYRRQVEALKRLNQIRLREHRTLPLGRVTVPAHELAIWEVYYTDLLAAFAPTADPQDIHRAVGFLAQATANPASFACFADVVPSLRRLAAGGVKLGLISNAYPSARAILCRLKLERWFDVILLSNEIDCAKPAAAIYQRALNELAVPGERAIYLDDRARYLCLDGGLHLPLHAALLDRGYGWLEPQWHGPVLHSLAELNTVASLATGLSCPMQRSARMAA